MQPKHLFILSMKSFFKEHNIEQNLFSCHKDLCKKEENHVTENKIAVVVYEQTFRNLTGGHLAEL